MRTLPRTYAEALLRSVHQVSEQEVPRFLSRFRQVVEQRGHERLFTRIGREIERVYAIRARQNGVRLVVAQEQDIPSARERAATRLSEAERERMQIVVDDSLIGGFVLETPATFIDESYKRKLVSLYQRMVER